MKKNQGFTLIELLAVVVILGILLLIAVPSVTNIISNSKKKAFLADCQAYLQSAKYKIALTDSKNPQYFDIRTLDIKNPKDSYYGAIYFFDLDEDGNNEYYLYVYDENQSISLGSNEYSKIIPISEKEISTSKITNVLNKYSKEIKSNFKENNRYVNASISGKNIKFNKDTLNLGITEGLDIGEKVYVPMLDKYYKNYECSLMTVISSEYERTTLLDPQENLVSNFGNVKGELDARYYKYKKYENDIVMIRLLSVGDLEYLTDYNKYGFTVDLFKNNKDIIAKLFHPYAPTSFYYSEWKDSKSNRFISLGDYSNNDRCQVDGTLGNNSTKCYSFDLTNVYSGGEPIVKEFDPKQNSSIIVNYVLTLKNAESYVGYKGTNICDKNGKNCIKYDDPKAACQQKLTNLLNSQ